MAEQTEIRGLMIPVTNGRVLLPNASVPPPLAVIVPVPVNEPPPASLSLPALTT